jgi:hypothetical protein
MPRRGNEKRSNNCWSYQTLANSDTHVDDLLINPAIHLCAFSPLDFFWSYQTPAESETHVDDLFFNLAIHLCASLFSSLIGKSPQSGLPAAEDETGHGPALWRSLNGQGQSLLAGINLQVVEFLIKDRFDAIRRRPDGARQSAGPPRHREPQLTAGA